MPEAAVKSSLAQILILAIAGTLVQETSATESANSINFGLGGINPMPHCDAKVFTIEYEHLLIPTIAVLGRGSGVNYTDDDSDYLEEGRLRGLDVGARYYPSGRLQGFYTGGSLGYWNGDWTFIENRNTPDQWEGEADSDALRLNVDLGYRLPIRGTHLSVMPVVNIGKFFTSSSCEYTAPASRVGTPCSQSSVVDLYIFAGVTVGIAF